MGFTEKASEKARQLAEAAKTKADEYGVRERVAEYGGKAAELAGRGVDAASAGIDKATGGRFHDQIDTVHGKVGETLQRARGAGGTDADGPTLAPGAAPDAVAETTAPPSGTAADPTLAPGAAPDAVAETTGPPAGGGAADAEPTLAPGAAPDAVAETTGPQRGAGAADSAVTGQAGEPITPASTNPDAERPGTS